jgi:hypothetical protein
MTKLKATFVDQIFDLQSAERDPFSHLHDCLDRPPGFFAIPSAGVRHEPRDALATPCNHDFLAFLDPVEEAPEGVLRLECSNFVHRRRPLNKLVKLAYFRQA